MNWKKAICKIQSREEAGARVEPIDGCISTHANNLFKSLPAAPKCSFHMVASINLRIGFWILILTEGHQPDPPQVR